MENSMVVPQRTKFKTTRWLKYSIVGYISEENENTNSKRYMHPKIHKSIIFKSQYMEATQLSSNRWMNKERKCGIYVCVCIYIYRILLSHKKNETLQFATMWIDLESIMLSEIRQRLFYCLWHLTKKHKYMYITK